MPHLFNCWEEVSRRVRETKELRIFLDFDGTLVNYRSHPEAVKLTQPAKCALRRLVKHGNVRVAIVSGRRRSVVARHVKVSGVRFMGLYGWEDGKNPKLAGRTIQVIRRLHKVFASLPAEAPGISVEDKGISVAVHFRGASGEMRRRAKKRVRRAVEKSGSSVHVIRSNDVWDVVPKQVRGKGDAVRKALQGDGRRILPIYVGDDATDESAFAALREGITVLTGPSRKTAARYRLKNPEEVRVFLERLETQISSREKLN